MCSHFVGAAGLQQSLLNTLQVSDGRCNTNIIYYYIFLAVFLDFPWSRWRMSSINTEAVGTIIHTSLMLLWVAIASFTMEKCIYSRQSPPHAEPPRRGCSPVLPWAVRKGLCERPGQRSSDEEKYVKYFSPPAGDRPQSYYHEAGGSEGRRLWVLWSNNLEGTRKYSVSCRIVRAVRNLRSSAQDSR